MTRATGGLWVRAWAFMALCCVASQASAQDAVKLSGLWVQPVIVRSIRGGQVHYQTPSGVEMARPIDELQGLKLGRYPALALAQDAVEAGDDPEAVGLLGQVTQQADEPWVRGYAGWRLVQAHVRLGDADRAAGHYIDMVVSGAERFFIVLPPADVVSAADLEVRLEVSRLSKTAMGTVGPQRQALLRALIDAAGNPSPKRLEIAGAAGSGVSDAAGAENAAGVVLSASVPPGPIVEMLRRGEYDRALRAADQALARPGNTASLLYLKGMAQLTLARRLGEEQGYLSAGLSFMRVLVYFPQSAVAGPAKLEAGYVHQLIGRPDIAARLYEEAGPLIDAEEDPAYYQRLHELTGALSHDGASGD